jgi:hypothetical protein
MPRALGTLKEQSTIDVVCIDNGNSVKSTVIMHKPDVLVVEIPGGIRLTMKKHPVQSKMYVASYGGMEFQCTVK